MMELDDRAHYILSWESSLAVPVVLLCMAAAYQRRCRRVKVSWGQVLCFCTGLFGFYVVLFTGFDYYAEHAFFVHRIQQAVLHHLAPFLIIISRPEPVLMAGLPAEWANGMRRFGRWRPVHLWLGFLNHPASDVA